MECQFSLPLVSRHFAFSILFKTKWAELYESLYKSSSVLGELVKRDKFNSHPEILYNHSQISSDQTKDSLAEYLATWDLEHYNQDES